MRRLILMIVTALLFTGWHSAKAQTPLRVYNEKGEITYPWTGGMNSCQFHEIDLDLDGIKDLLVFDRVGNRIIPFIKVAKPSGTYDFLYAPEYITLFPDLEHWVILRDFNKDGKQDIFTFSPGFAGIRVFRNVSNKELLFVPEVYPYLTSFQGGGYTNILVTYVDYPGIADIDNDGDLDILTFWGLGTFVEYHQNQSIEKYGIPDSLDYVRKEICWGRFGESDESNALYLDTCPFKTPQANAKGHRHTGSTLLLTDLDNDNDQDLILSDIDYPNVAALFNGGSPDTAFMTGVDTIFPSYDESLWLFSMPAVHFLDITGDGVSDLLCSPFDPNPFVSRNKKSNWLYQNIGTEDQPQFELIETDFLQSQTLDFGSGAYPVFTDYNGDGLTDIVVGNYGYYDSTWYDDFFMPHSSYISSLALLENSGDENDPVFNLVDDDLAGLALLEKTGLYPAFGDLDADGDIDLICGSDDGSLLFLENISGNGNFPEYEAPMLEYQGIDVGDYSTPQIFDIDNDGLYDLIIGEKKGNLNYYRNTGSAQEAEFTLITDSLGKVNVTNYNLSYNGYSTPYFFRDLENNVKLLVGSEQGEIFLFTDIENNLNGAFSESDSLAYLIDEAGEVNITNGYRTAATIGDLDGEPMLELITGNFSGGLNFYPFSKAPNASGVNNINRKKIDVYPNPVKNHFFVDVSDYDTETLFMEIYDLRGNHVFSRISRGNTVIRIQTNDLNTGIYLLKISARERLVYQGKIMKLHK